MNEIYVLLRQVLLGEFARQGMPIRVMQSYAGVSSGPPDVPALVMHHIASERVGWQSRDAKIVDGESLVIEKQNVAETIQFNAVMPFVKPEDETEDTPTVQGVLTLASMVLQSKTMLDALKGAGMGMQVVKPIISNYIQNEKEQWENVPSFDLIVCHKLTLTHAIGVVKEFTSGFYRV